MGQNIYSFDSESLRFDEQSYVSLIRRFGPGTCGLSYEKDGEVTEVPRFTENQLFRPNTGKRERSISSLGLLLRHTRVKYLFLYLRTIELLRIGCTLRLRVTPRGRTGIVETRIRSQVPGQTGVRPETNPLLVDHRKGGHGGEGVMTSSTTQGLCKSWENQVVNYPTVPSPLLSESFIADRFLFVRKSFSLFVPVT